MNVSSFIFVICSGLCQLLIVIELFSDSINVGDSFLVHGHHFLNFSRNNRVNKGLVRCKIIIFTQRILNKSMCNRNVEFCY